MPEVPLSEAAARLGVSVDTVRRRLRSGELAGRQVGRRALVSLPEAAPQPGAAAATGALEDVRGERDRLAEVNEALLDLLRRASDERSALLRIVERLADRDRP